MIVLWRRRKKDKLWDPYNKWYTVKKAL